MPTDYKTVRRASNKFEGPRRAWGRIAIAVCSCFVLLALSVGGSHVQGAGVKFNFDIRVKGAFTTVKDRNPNDLPECGQAQRDVDRACVYMTTCKLIDCLA